MLYINHNITTNLYQSSQFISVLNQSIHEHNHNEECFPPYGLKMNYNTAVHKGPDDSAEVNTYDIVAAGKSDLF